MKLLSGECRLNIHTSIKIQFKNNLQLGIWRS